MEPIARYFSPTDIRDTVDQMADPIRRTQVFADMCRFNTLYMIRQAGSGHIGSSFSAMEVVSWLYREVMNHDATENIRPDIYISSKGHDVPGLYAVLIALGRLPADHLHQLRRVGGLPGHPDVRTEHMVTNTGSLGMGISKVKGLVQAARLDYFRQRVFVLTGDGELQEGQIWESLIGAVNRRMGEITVIVDHNKIQSDTWISRVSDLGDVEAKFAAFGWEVARLDGHDLAALHVTFRRFATITDRPKVIIADTIKGKGVSFMDSSAYAAERGCYGYHSGAPTQEEYGQAMAELEQRIAEGLATAKVTVPVSVEMAWNQPPEVEGENLIRAYTNALLDLGQRRDDVVVLDGDLMLDCGLIPFREVWPERFVECGIAEMDMVSQAGGLALAGKLPIVHSFACFLSTRANEHIYNNATEGTKIIYVGSLAGLVPGGPGHSHQSVRDIAALAAVPGLTMIEPGCATEVEMALEWASRVSPTSTYLRLASVTVPITFELPDRYKYERGKGVKLVSHGKDFVVFGYGPVLLNEAMKALKALAGQGRKGTLFNLPWLNVMDQTWFDSVVAKFNVVVSLDNHYSRGGQGDLIARSLLAGRKSGKVRFASMAVETIPLCGTNEEVLDGHGLDAAGLEKRIAGLFS